jgi:hypothetical protein
VVLTSNPQGLQSLIQLLVQPVGEDVQKAVLATICEIFYKRTNFEKVSRTKYDTSTYRLILFHRVQLRKQKCYQLQYLSVQQTLCLRARNITYWIIIQSSFCWQ